MARRLKFASFCLFAGLLSGQQQPPAPVEPPEEDETLMKEKKEYEFNPLQAQKEIKIGLYYMKKGSYRAASGRFLEATYWDPTSADALYELGKARERAGNQKGKKEAWTKFLELAPDDKRAAEVRKKLDPTK
ncbi:hypothetical protein [Bryobacter aggregatus]|uniref:hypothetical protein n=1 Tax=Bryobacter aggregatus TaxID=360054 RepID=UPI0012BAC91B|nr:hypothetical protein [Bryobacter aggregatus]